MTAQSEIWGTDSVTDVAAWAGCRRRGDGVATKPASFCLLIVVDRECVKTIFTDVTTQKSISGECLERQRQRHTGAIWHFFNRSLTWSEKRFIVHNNKRQQLAGNLEKTPANQPLPVSRRRPGRDMKALQAAGDGFYLASLSPDFQSQCKTPAHLSKHPELHRKRSYK